MWTLLGGALAAEPTSRLLPVPDTPLSVEVTTTGAGAWEFWDGMLTHPGQPLPAFAFVFQPMPQPDLGRMPLAAWNLGEWHHMPGVSWDPPVHLDHPTLGPSIAARGRGAMDRMSMELRAVSFATAEGTGAVVGVAFEGRGGLDAELAALTARLRFPPALPASELQTGEVHTPSGYVVTLPEGWRARTLAEGRRVNDVGSLGGVPVTFVAFDPSRLWDEEPPELKCRLADGPLDVVDPTRAPAYEAAARSRLDLFLPSTSSEIQGVGRFRVWAVDPQTTPPAELVELADRPAYLWRVLGRDEALGLERRGLALTTSWDQLTLDCFVATEIDGEDRTAEMEAVLRSIHVEDGEAHPMDLSTRAWYYRNWPFRHPLLEAWALVGYGFIVGGVFVVRELRS